MSLPDFSRARSFDRPFKHFRAPDVISEEFAAAILSWLDEDAPLALRTTDFYEQHELSLVGLDLPIALRALVSSTFVDAVSTSLSKLLDAPSLAFVDASIHRLRTGQTIRIHNDHIGAEETHRLVIQLNRGWMVEQGGLLMLFGEDNPESVTDVILPVHRSGFGFEISQRSHHAVSTIRDGARDSVVYTFRIAA